MEPHRLLHLGFACRYAHSVDELNVRPDLRGTKLCPSIVNTGRCQNKDCKFAHSKGEFRRLYGPRPGQKSSCGVPLVSVTATESSEQLQCALETSSSDEMSIGSRSEHLLSDGPHAKVTVYACRPSFSDSDTCSFPAKCVATQRNAQASQNSQVPSPIMMARSFCGGGGVAVVVCSLPVLMEPWASVSSKLLAPAQARLGQDQEFGSGRHAHSLGNEDHTFPLGLFDVIPAQSIQSAWECLLNDSGLLNCQQDWRPHMEDILRSAAPERYED